MGAADSNPTIWVVAGPNGAGKSSIVGETIRQSGGAFYNPDEVARALREREPRLQPERANELAWREGKRLLEQSIAVRRNFAFETTLGGTTIASLLHKAAREGISVRMWFLALGDPDQHVARVRSRVLEGGHDIPEALIRERYDRSRENLVALLPRLDLLRVYDNSMNARPGGRAKPRLVLEFREGRVVNRSELASTPSWAKAIVAAALLVERTTLPY